MKIKVRRLFTISEERREEERGCDGCDECWKCLHCMPPSLR